MKAKILTLLTLMVMTCMSLTSMAQEPILILVEENGNEVTQPSQESSFSFPQEETTTTTTTTEPSSFNSGLTHLEEEVLTLTFEDEDASAAKAAEEARRAEEARLAEEARRAEEARLAEEARRAEEARLAEEARRAEEARLAEEARRAEEARLAEEARRAEEARLAEEARRAEEARLAEEARRAEEARLAEEARRAEEARLAEEARRAEEARLAEEARRAEEARLAEEARRAEEARLAEEARRAEEARLAEEARRAEEARLAEEARRAEEARLAEEARRAEEARLAEEARRAEEARLAEEARRAEEARLAEEKAAAQTEQVKPTQPTTEEQNLEERVATAVAAEARALEAAAKAEEAAKKATEEREKIEALQNAQGMPAQTEQQQAQVQPTTQLPAATQGLENVTDTEPVKQTVRERYYKKSGTNFLSIVSVGYSTVFLTPNRMDRLTPTEFAGKRHFINFEILEWRAKLFGMQLFNFEIGVNTPGWTESGTYLTKLMSGEKYNKIGYGSGLKEADARTMWFAYKPAIKLYIPCSDWLALELYGGMEIDLTTAWSKINPLYYRYNKDIPGLNYFLGAYGGLGLMLTPAPAVPIEIKAEYRHPVQGNMDIVPQGFYLSTQLHLGAPIRKTQKNKK